MDYREAIKKQLGDIIHPQMEGALMQVAQRMNWCGEDDCRSCQSNIDALKALAESVPREG